MKIALVSFLLFSIYLINGAHCFFKNAISRIYCYSENCYELLGVSPSANVEEIRSSYYTKIRHVNLENNVEKKKKIIRAYKILTNRRTKRYYDYYLKSPNSFINVIYFYMYWFYKALNGILITLLFLCILTFFQYINNRWQIRALVNKCSKNKQFRKKVNDMIAEKYPDFNKWDNKKKDRIRRKTEEIVAEEMILINGEKITKLKFFDLFIVRFFYLPNFLYAYILWNIKWFINYNILKKEYSEGDRIYITRKYMKLSAKKWDMLEEMDKNNYLKKELWIKENAKQYLQEQKEIEHLNRINSSKYKKELRSRKKGTSYNYND